LTRLTKKGEKFNWTVEQQNSFQLLKEKLTTAPVLNYPDFQKEFLITTDASDLTIGAVLSQSPISQDRPLAYANRILCKAEQNTIYIYYNNRKRVISYCMSGKIFPIILMEQNLK